jgi:hypothetical protein
MTPKEAMVVFFVFLSGVGTGLALRPSKGDKPVIMWLVAAAGLIAAAVFQFGTR